MYFLFAVWVYYVEKKLGKSSGQTDIKTDGCHRGKCDI